MQAQIFISPKKHTGVTKVLTAGVGVGSTWAQAEAAEAAEEGHGFPW